MPGSLRVRRRRPGQDFADWFWGGVDRSDPDGCWPWRGARNSDGYGIARDAGGKVRTAHTLAFEMTVGRPIAEGLEALHECDNRLCCRVGPRHLGEGTHRQNLRDAFRRGAGSRRRRDARGRLR